MPFKMIHDFSGLREEPNLTDELWGQAGPESTDGSAEYRRDCPRRCIGASLDLEVGGEMLLAKCRNVGEDSMSIFSRQFVGTHRVRVRIAMPQGMWHEACVVHCTETIGGYKVGLVFGDRIGYTPLDGLRVTGQVVKQGVPRL